MLRKQNRLRRAEDVKRVRQQGQGWRHPLVILLVMQNDLEVSRFAFSASRAVGKAVVRNRAKRRLREIVRLQLAQIPSGWDCLLIARAQTAQVSHAELHAAVTDLLRRAHLLPRAISEGEQAPLLLQEELA